MDLERWVRAGLNAVGDWQDSFGSFEQHPSLQVSDDRVAEVFGEFAGRLRDNYPFFHPATPARCSSRRTRPRWPATSPRC
jgi:hypothetical protein